MPTDYTDSYGIDLQISPGGDLIASSSGQLAVAAGPAAVAQAVFLRLKTSLGDLPLHPAFGSRIANDLIGGKLNLGAAISEVNQQLRAQIVDDSRLAAARVRDGRVPASAGLASSAQISVEAKLSGGEVVSLTTVDSPVPSDVSLPTAIDPTIDPLATFDPTDVQEFFADPAEQDQLADLDAIASAVNDIPNPGL